MIKKSSEALRVGIDDSLGQKLLKVARLVNERAIVDLQGRGHPLREAHTRLFPHLDLDGIRLTDLAERAGMTKQSAQQLVDELVDEGYLKRRAHPEDGRAKLLVLTPKGRRGIHDGIDVLGDIEADVTRVLGAKKVADFGRVLDVMLEVLEA